MEYFRNIPSILLFYVGCNDRQTIFWNMQRKAYLKNKKIFLFFIIVSTNFDGARIIGMQY